MFFAFLASFRKGGIYFFRSNPKVASLSNLAVNIFLFFQIKFAAQSGPINVKSHDLF